MVGFEDDGHDDHGGCLHSVGQGKRKEGFADGHDDDDDDDDIVVDRVCQDKNDHSNRL